jgi:nicotinamide-nucleotide amidase
MAFSKRLADLAKQALAAAKAKNCSIVTAESCTAGKLSGLLAEAPGASVLLHGGFVAYTKDNKSKALGVSAAPAEAEGSGLPRCCRRDGRGRSDALASERGGCYYRGSRTGAR